MTDMPPQTLYHRLLGWHAPALRRAATATAVGLAVAAVLLPFGPWTLDLLAAWDAVAVTFLLAVGPIVVRADSEHTERLATREDETRPTAAALLVGASVVSLVGVGLALGRAARDRGVTEALLVGVAVLTVVLSWTLVNTVYTLHYAHLHFASAPAGIGFGDPDGQETPSYRDFAYVAFTIGMTYQVSDTTLRAPRLRRTVLSHALLSYLFGVVIVAGTVNLIAGLFH
jgi:uncharacterized membrane protein